MTPHDPAKDARPDPDAESGSTGSSGSSTWNEERGMTEWQIEDEAEILAYQAEVQAVLDEYGVTDINLLQPEAYKVVAEHIPEKPTSVYKYYKWSEEQLAENPDADVSIEAYFAAENKAYRDEKDQEIRDSVGL